MRFPGIDLRQMVGKNSHIGMLSPKISRFIWGVSLMAPVMVQGACSTARFSGSNPGRGQESTPTANSPDNSQSPPANKPGEVGGGDNQTAPLPNPPASPPPGATAEPPKTVPPGGSEPKDVPQCVPTEKLTGTRMVMVIDNSNSNAETDCPGPVQNGTFKDTKVYQCTQETSRSKAALAVYDLLKEVAEKDSSNPLAKSQLAVTYFPTKEDYVSGYKVEKGFTDTTAANRAAFAQTLAFTQSPYGMTPYVAAMTSIEKAFESSANDVRPKVVIFVTDGEATDRHPGLAISKAESLMGAGVQFMTIYYPTKDSRATRIAKHTAMMKEIDQNYVSAGGGHWYDEAQYKSFEDYIGTIVGNVTGSSNPQASTLLRISSKVDGACNDGASLCARKSYEVADASGLAQIMKQIIKREVIGCDPQK
jgi:hypothetical protein